MPSPENIVLMPPGKIILETSPSALAVVLASLISHTFSWSLLKEKDQPTGLFDLRSISSPLMLKLDLV